MIEEVNDYLLLLPGKLFRPTLVLLANEVGDSPNPDAVTFGCCGGAGASGDPGPR